MNLSRLSLSAECLKIHHTLFNDPNGVLFFLSVGAFVSAVSNIDRMRLQIMLVVSSGVALLCDGLRRNRINFVFGEDERYPKIAQ